MPSAIMVPAPRSRVSKPPMVTLYNTDVAQLRHVFGSAPFTTTTLLLAAKKIGVSAKKITRDLSSIDRAPLPAIGLCKEGGGFVL